MDEFRVAFCATLKTGIKRYYVHFSPGVFLRFSVRPSSVSRVPVHSREIAPAGTGLNHFESRTNLLLRKDSFG